MYFHGHRAGGWGVGCWGGGQGVDREKEIETLSQELYGEQTEGAILWGKEKSVLQNSSFSREMKGEAALSHGVCATAINLL